MVGLLQSELAGKEMQVLAVGSWAGSLKQGRVRGHRWAQQHLIQWPSQRAVWSRSKRWAAETL